jgi:ubiquinone/menaquinone biosynthesis C-methylase UbiE
MTFLRTSFVLLAIVTLTMNGQPASAEQLSSRPAAEWAKTLDRPERLAELRVDEIIRAIDLKPGQVVADLGAGTGIFAVPIGKAVGPGGKVYAVEIDEGYFNLISAKAKQANVTNVQPVLGKFTDPNLPASDVDVAFFHDVLHHIEDRAGYLKNLARYVQPEGRVVIIDLKAETSPHKDDPALVVSEANVGGWMKAAGFNNVEKVDLFADKFFLVFSR